MSEKRFFGFGEFGVWVRSQVQTLTDGLNLKANQNEVSDALATKLNVNAAAADSEKLGGQEPTHYATSQQMNDLVNELTTAFTDATNNIIG